MTHEDGFRLGQILLKSLLQSLAGQRFSSENKTDCSTSKAAIWSSQQILERARNKSNLKIFAWHHTPRPG